MSRLRVLVLTAVAMVAFASNSLLCRQALKRTEIDAATFTLIRILSGAFCLWIIVQFRKGPLGKAGSWQSPLALFAYPALFSYPYLQLTAAPGALLLFAAARATLVVWPGGVRS